MCFKLGAVASSRWCFRPYCFCIRHVKELPSGQTASWYHGTTKTVLGTRLFGWMDWIRGAHYCLRLFLWITRVCIIRVCRNLGLLLPYLMIQIQFLLLLRTTTTALLTDYTACCRMEYNIVLFTMLYYNLDDAKLSQLGLQGKTKRTKKARTAQQQQRRQGT